MATSKTAYQDARNGGSRVTKRRIVNMPLLSNKMPLISNKMPLLSNKMPLLGIKDWLLGIKDWLLIITSLGRLLINDRQKKEMHPNRHIPRKNYYLLKKITLTGLYHICNVYLCFRISNPNGKQVQHRTSERS